MADVIKSLIFTTQNTSKMAQELNYQVMLQTTFSNGNFEVKSETRAEFKYQDDATVYAFHLYTTLRKKGTYDRRGASVLVTTEDGLTILQQNTIS